MIRGGGDIDLNMQKTIKPFFIHALPIAHNKYSKNAWIQKLNIKFAPVTFSRWICKQIMGVYIYIFTLFTCKILIDIQQFKFQCKVQNVNNSQQRMPNEMPKKKVWSPMMFMKRILRKIRELCMHLPFWYTNNGG